MRIQFQPRTMEGQLQKDEALLQPLRCLLRRPRRTNGVILGVVGEATLLVGDDATRKDSA